MGRVKDTLIDDNGDYAPLSVNAKGELYINLPETTIEEMFLDMLQRLGLAPSPYEEDRGTFILGVRKD